MWDVNGIAGITKMQNVLQLVKKFWKKLLHFCDWIESHTKTYLWILLTINLV